MKKIYFLILFTLSLLLINTKIFAVEISAPRAILIDMDSEKII